MARTKYEIDALTDVIYTRVVELRDKKLNSAAFKRQVKEYVEDKGYFDSLKLIESNRKEQMKLFDRSQKIIKLISKQLRTQPIAVRTKEDVLLAAAQLLSGYTPVTKEQIANMIILNSDAGSEIVIKNIIKEYV